MNSRYPRFRFTFRDGSLVLREGLAICFYLRHSHAELWRPVLHSVEVFRRAVGARALNWSIDWNGDPERLTDALWEELRREMAERRSYSFLLEEKNDQVSGYSVEYKGAALKPHLVPARDYVNGLHYFLPVEYLEEQGPEAVKALTLQLVSELPISYGYVSLAFNYGDGLHRTGWKVLKPWCFRYPGMDVPNVSRVGMDLGGGVRNAYWLTLLGPPVLEELGGVSGLRGRLRAPAITVEELPPARALVCLGEWPETGDMEAGLTLPQYRELALVLEPWQVLTRLPFGTLTEAEQRRWDRRFLEPPAGR